MKRAIHVLLFLFSFPFVSLSQKAEMKTLKAIGTLRTYKVCVLPATLADDSLETLMKTVDTTHTRDLPGYQVYVVPQNTNPAKPAIIIYKNLVIGTSNWKFMIQQLYPNGNIERSYTYDKKMRLHPLVTEQYDNQRMKSVKHYSNGRPIKRWKYFDAEGRKLKVEIYRHGSLKRTKIFPHPRRSLRVMFSFRNKRGIEWVIY
jgi:hypothetical protein